METQVNWNEALDNGEFIKLEDGKPTSIVITNWSLIKTEKDFNGKKEEKVEFRSNVTELNGTPVEKQFNTVSNRLKAKLKDVLINKDPLSKVHIKVTKVGDKYNTNYLVEELNQVVNDQQQV